MSERKHKDWPSSDYPEVGVHITWTTSDKDRIVIRGYAIDISSGIKKEYAREFKCTARNNEELNYKLDELFNRVCLDIRKHEHEPLTRVINSESESDSQYDVAFNQLKEMPFPVSYWSPRYTQNRLTYFERNILPLLNKYDITEWSESDTKQLLEEITEKIILRNNSSHHVDKAKETARKNLVAANTIFRQMQRIDPSIPDLNLLPGFIGRKNFEDQIKSLPVHVRRKLIRMIEELINENPRLALAAVLSVDAGLRPAESASVFIDDVLFYEKVTVIHVQHQISKGEKDSRLKNVYSYRLVPLSFWGSEMTKRCFSKLSESSNNMLDPGCNPLTLSNKLKHMLIEAGLSKDFLISAENMMDENPDYDTNGKKSRDVISYCLRRDYSSRCRNICGLSSYEIDYLLGHIIKLPKKMHDDLRLIDKQEEISKKLERYVHSTDFSMHPAVVPIEVQPSVRLTLVPYDIIRIRNASSETVAVELDIEALVNSDHIELISPQNSNCKSTIRNIPTNCTRKEDLPIGRSLLNKNGEFL